MASSRVTVAHSAAEMDYIALLWERLLSVQPHSLFQRFAWNRLAAAIFAERLTPFVVAVESEPGAAIIPAAIHRDSGHIELLGDALFDYRDVLHTGDPEVLRTAWSRLAEEGLPLCINGIQGAAGEERWPGFSLLPFASAPEVRRDGISEAQFRSAHSRLGRHLRRIQKKGVTLGTHTGTASELVRYLYQCKCDQFAGDANNIFRDSLRREFMVSVAAAEGENCEIFTLTAADGQLVAGLITFRDQGWRRFYTIYFDPAWASYSPGTLLVYEATARSLSEGLDCDYMTGEHPYKLRFANSSHALFRLDLSAAELGAVARNTVSNIPQNV